MELDIYLESVRRGVQNATALADDQTRSVAERLGATLDDAGRLALITALSDAAAEISRELSPGSVELRMAGSQPEFVVTLAPSQLTGDHEEDEEEEITSAGDAPAADPAPDADEPTARVTLRLPASVKTKVDEAALAEGLSANAWLMRTVLTALTGRPRSRRPQFGPGGGYGPRQPGPRESGPRGFGRDFGPGDFGPSDFSPGECGPDRVGPDGAAGGEQTGGGADGRGRGGRRGRGRGAGGRGGRGPGQRITGWAI